MLGEGVNGHRTLLKMLIMNFLHFQSTFLEGREGDTKKEYSVYAFDNVDNYGRLLTDVDLHSNELTQNVTISIP